MLASSLMHSFVHTLHAVVGITSGSVVAFNAEAITDKISQRMMSAFHKLGAF
jgi:hypothetical protein